MTNNAPDYKDNLAFEPKDKLTDILDKIRGIDTSEQLAEFAGVEVEESRVGIKWIEFECLYFYDYGNIEHGEDAVSSIVLKEKAPFPQMAMIIAGLRGW